MPEERQRTDWESVERDYRAGVLSIREIAKINGCSDTAIRKKATAAGWERDLAEKVNAKVRSELVRDSVRTANPQTEREIVDVAAATVVQVVRSHRKSIKQGNALVELLTQQLIDVAGRRDEFEEGIEEETASDKSPERRNRMLRAISLATHASVAVSLAAATKTWVSLERQAFSIKDETAPPAEDSLASILAAVNGTSLPIVK